ncbi:hypothetical protein G4B88_014494 [Cannabis sativa]|uniref:Cytochrome P450 n=1 Tax=Cannabis sativa TaxID=3483 RepID=A0A7J6IAH3_CANSA|nr:hypothetical protein G4B88_014494 [Cannabis sativa]
MTLLNNVIYYGLHLHLHILILFFFAILSLVWFWLTTKRSSTVPPLPPGPRGWPIVGYLPFLSPNLHIDLSELAKVYGPIFRLWMGTKLYVVITSPQLVGEVVSQQDKVFANRDVSISAFIYTHGGNNVAFAPYGPKWKNYRKIMVQEMSSTTVLSNLYCFRKEEVRKSVRWLFKNVNTPIDIGRLAYQISMNNVMRMTIGATLEGDDVIHRAFEVMIENAMAKRKKVMSNPLADLFVGGTDTTISTVEWAMAEMLKNPSVLIKVQEELKQIVGLNNNVEESHLTKLTYLNNVFKETLRLHPPAPFLLPRSPTQSTIVGGYTIPKGSTIFLNVWSIHRDPSIWENPLEFKPERFDESGASGNNYNFLGRRICAGISLVERMVMLILASFLHYFDWKLPSGTKIELSDKFGLVVNKKNPLKAIPTPRLSNVDLYTTML